VSTNLDTLLTALYVWIDDRIAPERRPGRPPALSDAELVTVAVAQALLGIGSERRWLRTVGVRLPGMFPALPRQPGYNKRLRAASGLLKRVIRALAADTAFWCDDVWIADSTPVPCGTSRETVQRSELAGWAQYGYCASHSRWFWGLRLHLLCTPAGLPVSWALAGAKADERDVLLDMLDIEPHLLAHRPGQTILADKGYTRREFETALADRGANLIIPAYRGRPPRPGQHLLKPFRQLIESVNQTLKSQLSLEDHGGRTIDGVATRIGQRLLALTAAIWHNHHTGQPITRNLTAYDH
jgi:hypothetical protein